MLSRAAVLALLLLFACGVTALSSPQPKDGKAEKTSKATAQDKRGTDEVPFSVKIMPAQDADKRGADDQKEKEKKLLLDEALVHWTWALFIATGALAFFALVQVGLFWWQLSMIREAAVDAKTAADAATVGADAAKTAADAAVVANELNRGNMIAARRAWMSIDDIQLLAPSSVGEDRATFKVSATVKNVGQTPATSVWVTFHSHIHDEGEDPGAYARLETGFRDSLREHPAALGVALFPNEEFIQKETSSEHVGIAGSLRQLDGVRGIFFTIFVGVSYRIVGDEATHITSHPFMSRAPVGSRVVEPIKLQRDPFLAGYAD